MVVDVYVGVYVYVYVDVDMDVVVDVYADVHVCGDVVVGRDGVMVVAMVMAVYVHVVM